MNIILHTSNNNKKTTESVNMLDDFSFNVYRKTNEKYSKKIFNWESLSPVKKLLSEECVAFHHIVYDM